MESVRVLIAAGANLNHRDRNGNTALICAVLKHRTDVVKELTKAGAELNIRERQHRKSAIMYAVSHEQHEIAQILKDAGASIRPNETKRVKQLLSSKEVSKEAVSEDSKK